MASTDARPLPIKNTAYRAVFPILDADGDLVTGAAALDSEISKDQGTFTDCTNEATEIATSSGLYYLDISSTEMNADCVAVIVKTSTSGAKTTVLVLYPQESGDIKVDVQSYGGSAGTFASGRPEVNTTHIAGSAVSTSTAQLGVNVVNFGGSAGTFASGRPEVNTTHLAGSAISQASGVANVNVAQISGDSVAADNLENAFDDTAGANRWTNIIDQGTAQAATGTTLRLRAAAAFADSELNGCWVVITGGTTGVGQTRQITAYVSATDTCTVDTWTTTPTGTITYQVVPGAMLAADVTKFGGTAATTASGRPEVNTTHIAGAAVSTSSAQLGVNVVQAGATAWASGAITAASIASNAITSAKIATDAIGSAQIADGAIDAATLATGTITAAKFAAGAIDAAAIAADAIGSSELATTAVDEIVDAVWDELTSGHVASGSFGQALFRIRTGTAQAGANGSITLDGSASATDDFYKNGLIVLSAGTGANQARTISGYTGSSKIATVTPNWVTNPSSDSVFVILPAGSIAGATAPTAAEVADAVWDEARSGHPTSGTFGEGVASVQGSVTGSVASVTGAVGSVTGNVGGNVVGSVASVTGAVGSVTGNVGGNVTGSVGSMASGGIAAASFAAGAIDASAIAADAIGSSELAATAASEIATAVRTELTTELGRVDAAVSTRATPAQVNTEADTALSDVGVTTTITGRIDAAISSRSSHTAADTWAVATRTLSARIAVKKNTALANFPVKLVDLTDGYTAETGVTVTATRSLDGAAFAACANAVSEIASGWYKITLATTDLNADTVILRFTGTGCRDTEVILVTEP